MPSITSDTKSAGRPLRVKVLHVLTSICEGGMSRYVIDLISNLDSSKFEVHIVCTHFAGPHFEEVRQAAASATVLNARSQRQKLTSLIRTIKAMQPDIVHSHQEPIANIAARLSGIRSRFETVHSAQYWLADGSFITQALSHSCGQHYVVNTQAEERIIRSVVQSSAISVIHPGIDTTRWESYFSKGTIPSSTNHGIAQNSFVIGSISRLDAQKGIMDLLEAAHEIQKQIKNPFFLIVGDGDERARLERKAADLGLSNRILFAGYQKSAYRWLGAMDIFVMPSHHESWGLAEIEALGAGVPTVCANVDGPAEYLTDQKTALMVQPGDPQAIANAAVRLYEDRTLAANIAASARELVVERLSIRSMIDQYDQLYSSSLAVR